MLHVRFFQGVSLFRCLPAHGDPASRLACLGPIHSILANGSFTSPKKRVCHGKKRSTPAEATRQEKAKRVEKRTQLARQNSDNPLVRLADSEVWPIVAAWAPEGLWEQGIGTLILARRMPDGQLACAVFLADVFCLGVKRAYWRIMTQSDYEALLHEVNTRETLQQVAPPFLAKLVLEVVDYAKSLGIAPHPQYGHARILLTGIDPNLCSDVFEFGMDGKPHYIRGPHESLEKAALIVRKIQLAGGEFVIPLKPEEKPFADRLDDQWAMEIEHAD